MPNESPQGNAAASGQQTSILGLSSSSTGVTYELNGVTLDVANNPPAYPTPGTPEQHESNPEWFWPTSAMAMRTSVLMSSGETWALNRPPSGLFGGGIQVSIKPRQMGARPDSRIAVFNVAEADLETPIWFVGYAQPVPEPPEPPTPVDPGNLPPDQEPVGG